MGLHSLAGEPSQLFRYFPHLQFYVHGVDVLLNLVNTANVELFVKTRFLVRINMSSENLSNHSNTTAVKPLRVLAATLVFFVIANVVFAVIDPPVEDLILFNRVLPGFQRFPYPLDVREQGGELKFSWTAIRNLNILFPSHIISAGNKPKDEYRIILVGDSSAWGAFLREEQTVAEQINQAQLRVCDNRRAVVYNLAYPGLSGIKDLMLLSEAVKSYQPDIIIWSFTINSFKLKGDINDVYADSNYDRLRALEQSTGYNFGSKRHKPGAATFMDRTIYGRRGELNLLLRLYWFDLKSMSIGTDHLRTQEAVENDQMLVGNNENFQKFSGGSLEDVLNFQLLFAAQKLAGTIPVVYVNEPIYVDENSPDLYNRIHPRWIYDQYRDLLRNISDENSWVYVDLWNSLPPEEFTGVFHRTFEGETRVAQELIPVILTEACRK